MLIKAGFYFSIYLAVLRTATAPDCSRKPVTPLQQLENKLLCNYLDIDSRPVKNKTTKTEVDIRFMPVIIRVVDGKDVIKVSGSLNMSWKDEYLEWNASAYGNIQSLHVEMYEVWRPRLTSAYSYQMTWYEFVDENDLYTYKDMIVKPNGEVTAIMTIQIHGPCTYDISVWPYDIWNCNLTIGKRRDDEFVIVKFKSQTALDLSKVKFASKEWDIQYVSDPAVEDFDNSDYLELSLVMQRKLDTYKSVFIVPEYVLLFISTLPYWFSNNTICRLLMHFSVALIQIILLQILFVTVTGDSGHVKIWNNKCMPHFFFLLFYFIFFYSFYLSGLYLNILGLVITLCNGKFKSRIQDPPKCVQDLLSTLAYIPYFGPCFSFLVNDNLENQMAVGNDNECLLDGTSNDKFNKKWAVFLNFIDKSAFFASLVFILIQWLL